MSKRIYVLFGLLGATVGVYVWSRTQSGNQSVTDAVASIGDSVVNTIRGIRNNNPGNIKYSESNQWQGQTGQDSNGFATFIDEASGIRAIAVILKNYSRHYSLYTVDGLIRRWSATDQDAYVHNVSASLGVDSHDTIDTSDLNTLTALVEAIITQEDSKAAELALLATGEISAGVSAA